MRHFPELVLFLVFIIIWSSIIEHMDIHNCNKPYIFHDNKEMSGSIRERLPKQDKHMICSNMCVHMCITCMSAYLMRIVLIESS